jgi:hypothetical protein
VKPLRCRIRSSVVGTRASENSFVGARDSDAGSWQLDPAARALIGCDEKHRHVPSAARVAAAGAGAGSPGRAPSDRGPTIRPITTWEVAAVTGTLEAEELLLIEEADAWFEYLEATRGQTATRYREVEPWAWARLTQRLRAIRARRAKLRPAAA